MKTNRTTSSGPKIPNCTLLTSRRGALESPVYAILVNEIKHNKILYIKSERNLSSVCYFTTVSETKWLPYPGRKLDLTVKFAVFIYNSLITTGSTISFQGLWVVQTFSTKEK